MVTLKPGTAGERRGIAAFVAERLAAFKVPVKDRVLARNAAAQSQRQDSQERIEKSFRQRRAGAARMKIKDKIVVVTGGGDGIGKALCERFHKEGAKAVIVADLNGEKAEAVAKSVGGKAYKCDVANEKDIIKHRRGNRKEYRPDRSVLLECGARGPRSVARFRRIVDQRKLDAKLERACDVARVCSACVATAHDRARRRLFPQHEFGGGPVVADRQRRLCDDEACRGGVRRNPCDHPSRPGHSRFDALSAGSRHAACCAPANTARNISTAC